MTNPKPILDQRRLLVEEMCRPVAKRRGSVWELSGSKKMNISYCVIPKAGCTTWIRIFKFLAGQKLSTGNPMSISKYEVHYEAKDKYERFYIDRDSVFIKGSWRIMTVRDPYTRLWSAYIDKLLLPDFWLTKGRQIVRLTRPVATPESVRCGNDVTFPEFIEYVIRNGHDMASIQQDKHWLPVSDICDPCVYKPDVIAKQETFLRDLAYVLKEKGMTEILQSITSAKHPYFDLMDEIKYNFEIFKLHKHCTSIVGICKRMWIAFTLNGYIPATEKFPKHLETSLDLNVNSFYNEIMKVRDKFNITQEDSKQLRRKALIKAYSSIPKHNILALQNLYQKDFKFFNYTKLSDYLKF